MIYISITLMISGLILGIISINKAAYNKISPMKAALLLYSGLFLALAGAICFN